MAVVRYRDENGKIVPLRVIQGDKGDQMFVRFSSYADGTYMSEEWDDSRNYMGIAFGVSAPMVKSAYQWIRLSYFPDIMWLYGDNRLHIERELTFGSDRYAPREEIAKKAGVVTGYYTGGTGDTIQLSFPFVPKQFVIIGVTGENYPSLFISIPAMHDGHLIRGGASNQAFIYNKSFSISGTTVSIVTTDGFGDYLNANARLYSYVAIG